MLEKNENKCKKCIHFYKTMVGKNGFGSNPYPCCHLWEDKGERPRVLTRECFEKKKVKRRIKNIELSKKITDILDDQDFRIISVEQQGGEYIAELETYSPEGEDVIVDIWFDGTSRNFIDKFWVYATEFDADEHAESWVEHRGEGGCPSSIRALIEDADAIKRILTETAAKLRTGGGK